MRRELWNQLKKIQEIRGLQQEQHVIVDTTNHTFSIPGPIPKIYIPCNTIKKFHEDTKSIVKVIMGPYGSGKSSGCCAQALINSVAIPHMRDNVRRYRITIIRTTMARLETTVLGTWLSWFRYLGKIKTTKRPLTCTHTFNDGKGIVELQALFLALDSEDDNEKLASLETTDIYVNEMKQLNKTIYKDLVGRRNRYPPKDDLTAPFDKGVVLGDTNPPFHDHWMYKLFEEDCPPQIRLFKQPPGLIKDENNKWVLNGERDNKNGMSPNYYLEMAAVNPNDDEYIKVHCCGEYGILIPGRPVFHEYNDNLHSTESVKILKDRDIYVLWDYGLTPCALLCQLSKEGQFRAFKEFVTERSGIRQLAKIFVKPYLQKHCAGHTIFSVGDPANPTAQTDLNTCQNVLGEEGLPTTAAKTNAIEPRLNAVRDFLNRLIDGSPALIISRTGCPTLRKALKGEYCYRRIRVIGDEKYEDKPDKKHPWSDVADCLQYGCLEFAALIRGDSDDFDYKGFFQENRY